jgi:hypothetical protein
MNSRPWLLLFLLLMPAVLLSQEQRDKTSLGDANRSTQTFSILFNVSTVFYTAKDEKIDNFLTRYGYKAPQGVPVGLNFELAAIPVNSRMMYSLQASTIISKQDIGSTIFKAAAYRRIWGEKHFWISAGLGVGSHGSRIFLNGKMPPAFDSLANQYHKELVLRRTGFMIEPAVRFFWYPIRTRRFELGLFGTVAYDLSFNSRWKLGYYNPSGQFSSFKSLSKKTGVQTHREFGWAFSDGLSCRFKLD